jgi:transcriptional regulator with XRE-family HTH domain
MNRGYSSLAEKLKALMERPRSDTGRPHTSRSLSEAIAALPDSDVSLSRTAIVYLRNGTQANPTADTIVALAKALGDVPPAYLLPHASYDDIDALQAFEDPRVRQVLMLLIGLPDGELHNVIADLERRRNDLGLEPIPQSTTTEKSAKPKRRRSKDEAARYAADSLEGL